MPDMPDIPLVQPIDDTECNACHRPFNLPVVVPTDEGCRKCGHTKYAHVVDYGLGRFGCNWKHPVKIAEGCLCLSYESRRVGIK